MSEQSISFFLLSIYNRVIYWTEWFVKGKNWISKTFLFCVLFSILFSGGIGSPETNNGAYPSSYFQKIDHPLLDITKFYGLNSHDANLNFRLTVPVLLHSFGLRAPQWPPFLTIFAICSIIVAACIAGYQFTRDRVCAFFVALNVACTYVGSFGFIGYYDAIAISQLAFAALPLMPWWGRGILVFTASFTDERAWVASLILLVANFFFLGDSRNRTTYLRNLNFWAIATGMLCYLIVRLALVKFAGLSSPTGGVGPGNLVHDGLQNLHPVIWYSLEGGWVFFILAMVSLYFRKQVLAATSLILTVAAFLGFSLMIGDLMRSAIYIFPLLFVSLSIVGKSDTIPMLRVFCVTAFLISMIGGNYNVYLGKITWFQPMTIHWLQESGQALYKDIYDFLPHTMPRSQ